MALKQTLPRVPDPEVTIRPDGEGTLEVHFADGRGVQKCMQAEWHWNSQNLAYELVLHLTASLPSVCIRFTVYERG